MPPCSDRPTRRRPRLPIAVLTLLLLAGSAASAMAAPTVTRVDQLKLPFAASPTGVSFGPDGRRVAVITGTAPGFKVNGRPPREDALRIYVVPSSGRIDSVSGGRAALPNDTVPLGLDYSPNGDRVIVSASREDELRAFRVDPSGRISGSQAVSTRQPNGRAGTPDLVDVSPGGGLVATTILNGNWLQTYRLGADGKMVRVDQLRLATGFGTEPTALAFSRDGRHLSVSSYLCRCTKVFAVNPAGALDEVDSRPEGFLDLVYRPGGGAVATTFDHLRSMNSYAAGSAGRLGPLRGQLRRLGEQPELTSSPGGRFVAGAPLGFLELALYGLDRAGGVSVLHSPRRRSTSRFRGYVDADYSSGGRIVAAASQEAARIPGGTGFYPVGKLETYRVSPDDPNVLFGSVGVPYLGLEFTSGGLLSGATCTISAPCSWTLPLPPGMRATTATSGGATVIAGGVPTRAGTYPLTGTLRQRGKVVKTFRYTIRIVGPPTVTVTSPVNGRVVQQGARVIASYRCTPATGLRMADPGGCVGPVAHSAPIDTATPGVKEFTVVGTDAVGGRRSVTHRYTVVAPPSVPVTPPAVTPPAVTPPAPVGPPSATIATPADGASYAVGSSVSVRFSCAAAAGGTLRPGAEGCRGSAADGSALDTATPGTRSFTVTATDTLGQTTSRTSTYRVVGGPSVEISSPVADARVAVGAEVRAGFRCAAAAGGELRPGTEGCSGTVADGALIDTATAGTKTFAVTATDTLGQRTTVTRTYVVIGRPSASIAVPVAGASYPVGTVVRASFACDAAAGTSLRAAPEGCRGTVADGAPIDTSTSGTKLFAVTATDALGQRTTVTSTYRVVDAPTATITTPAVGARYAQGADVRAMFRCDAGSNGTLRPGTEGCLGTVAAGSSLDTATPGVKTFTVTATDTLGQRTTATRTYTVVPPPTVVITTPEAGANYDTNAPPQVSFSCTAGAGGTLLPGTAGCAGTQPTGETLAPMPLGPRMFTVTATDDLGQTTTKLVLFSVLITA